MIRGSSKSGRQMQERSSVGETASRAIIAFFAIVFAFVASPIRARADQLCPISIDPILDNVDLESATNGDTTWISIPISGSGEGASAESGYGDSYTRTHAQLISQPARFIIQLDQQIVAGQTVESSSSNGLVSVILHVSGINSGTAPVELTIDTFRSITPNAKSSGWVAFDDNCVLVGDRPWHDHKQQTITIDSNQELPPIVIEAFVETLGKTDLDVTTTTVITPRSCGGGGWGELPICYLPDCLYDDPGPWPSYRDWRAFDNSDDCGGGSEGGGAGRGSGAGGSGPGNGPDVWNSFGPGMHADVATGDVFTTVPIFAVTGEDPANLKFELRYDSLRNERASPVGPGWTHNLNRYVAIERAATSALTGRAVLYDGVGRRHGFRFIQYDMCCAQVCDRDICGEDGNGNPKCCCGGMCSFRAFERPFGRDFDLGPANIGTSPMYASFPNGERWDFSSEFGGPITRISDPRDGVTSFDYDSGGRLQTVTDKFGRTATFEYYADTGLLHIIHHPDALQTTLAYQNGRLSSITDPEGKTISFEYDPAHHRLTRETLKNGKIWNCAYQDSNPARRIITDSAGSPIVTVEAQSGFPLAPTDNRPVGAVTYKDGKNQPWQYQRDLWGRLTGWTTPNSNTHSFDYHTTYNGGGQAVYYPYYVAETGTDIGTRHYVRNTRGKATSIKDAYDHETVQTFGTTSRESLLTSRTSPRGLRREFGYEPTGDLNRISDFLNEEDHIDRTFEYEWYSVAGCLKSRLYVDANEHQTLSEYDTLGRLVRRTIGYGSPDAAVTEYENDAMGRRTMEKVHRNATTIILTKFEYDDMGRITDRYDDWGGANQSHTQYEYDGHGLLVRITNPRGVKTTFSYDLRNRVEWITEDEGGKNFLTHVQYDGNDNVWKITDALSRVSTFEYDGEDNLTRSIDAAGYETLIGRNAAGRATSINRQRSLTSSERDVRTIVYDLLQRPLYAYVAPGTSAQAETTIDYDGTPNCGCSPATPGKPLVHKVTDPTGKVSYRYYDSLDRLVKVVRKVSDTADNGGDADDAVTHIDYDWEGNITGITGPEGERVEYDRDAADNLRVVRAIGDSSTGNLSKSLIYDGSGNIKSITLPNGNVIELTYDGLDRLKTVNDSIGFAGELGYDENGNVTTWTDGRVVSRHFTYDTLDRLEKVFDADAPTPPSGPHTEIGYDAVGNRKWIVDKLNRRTEFTYDALDRLTQTTEDAATSPPPGSDTANTHTAVEYDGAGRTTSLTDHDGNKTAYAYDEAGNLHFTTYPGGGTDVVETLFNGVGDLTWRKDQRGIKTTYTYNDLHQLRTRTYRTVADVVIRSEEFGHDRSGRLKQADRLDGALVAATFDALGRRKSETLTYPGSPADAYTTSFDYTIGSAGSTRTVHYPHGRVVVETRDKRGRLSGVASSANSVAATWEHDLADRRFGAHLGGVIDSTFAFDDLDRLTRITHARGGAVVEALIDLEYGYDLVGNRTFTRDHLRTSQSETYVNDPRDRLRKIERGVVNSAGTAIDTPLVDTVRPARQDWTLDRRGNWSQTQEIRNGWTAPAQSRQANGKNEYTLLSQLVAPPDGVWNQVPEYDLAGNLLFEPRSPLSGNSSGDVDSLRYAYDEENRLIEVRRDQDNALLAKYAYDALGRRVQTLDYTSAASSPCLNTSSPLITRHLMAGAQTLEETVHCMLAAGGSGDLLVREFVWGDRFPEPVAMVTHGGAAGGMGGPAVPAGDAVFYYLPDILGSVLALADAAGNVVELYSYDPYGRTAIERHETSGAWTATAASSFGNPFAWTGQRYDAPVRLYHFLFRSYSPTLGRWLQRDPAGYVDGVNLLEGVRSNPMQLVDPFGLEIYKRDLSGLAPEDRDMMKGVGKRPYDNRDKCIIEGADRANAQTMSDLRAGLAALGDGALKTAIVADNISNVFFLKAFAKELAARGIKLVVKGGKKLFMQNGKELTARELRTIVLQVAKQLPKQIHHLATNKGAWKDVFEKLFSKAGMSLDDAANIMELPAHAGRHSDKYHEFVYDYLSKAVGSKTGQEAADALRSALQEVRQMLIDNPRLPFKDGGL